METQNPENPRVRDKIYYISVKNKNFESYPKLMPLNWEKN